MQTQMATSRKHPLAICEACPLQDQPCAPTSGPKDAEVVVVSRSPGYHEALASKPFSGPSGQVLTHLLKLYDYRREDVKCTNVVLCCHKEKNVPKAAIEACSPRLLRELDSAVTIIAGGSEAASKLARTSVDRGRGYVHRRTNSYGMEQRVIVTNNPAVVLYKSDQYPNLVKDFKLALQPTEPRAYPVVTVINKPDEGIRFLRSRQQHSVFGADIESRGGLTHRAKLVAFTLSATGEKSVVFGERCCTDASFLGALKEFLEDPTRTFVWHNGKFDVKILRYSHGINARIDDDTMLMSYALDERPGYHSLAYQTAEKLGWDDYEPPSVKEFKQTGIITNEDELYEYAGRDSAGTINLERIFRPDLQRDKLERPYKILIRAADVLARMETVGVYFDFRRAADIYEQEVYPNLISLREQLRVISGNPILNPNSSHHLAYLFYDLWGINHPAQRRRDKGRSVDKEARKEITEGRFSTKNERLNRNDDPLRSKIILFCQKLDRYAELQKQASTYLLSLIYKAEKDPDGKIYTEFLEHGTESGRLSSKEPNLQNITRTKEGLPNIRSLFYAPPGYKMVQADYSQAELRVIAYLSGDENLRAIYGDSNRSLHKEMASRFYGEDYDGEQYTKAKNINFGVAYGQSPFAFAQMYNMPVREAEKFVETWWATFPQVATWVKEVHKQVHSPGVLESPFGRRRRFHLVTQENKEHLYREAVNFEGQSTASDITLLSLCEIHDQIDYKKAQPVITVHDSIVAYVRDDYVDTYCKIAKDVMEECPQKELGWELPFVVDIGVGQDWGSTK